MGEPTHPRSAMKPAVKYRCCLCGPASLLGDRTEQGCECRASQTGFSKADTHLFVSCSRCSAKMSVECLDALASKVAALNYPLHDPEGVWRALKERPWAAGERPERPMQGWDAHKRAFTTCLLCEEGELPTAAQDPGLERIKKAVADYDPAVRVAVAVVPVFSDGRRAEPMAPPADPNPNPNPNPTLTLAHGAAR